MIYQFKSLNRSYSKSFSICKNVRNFCSSTFGENIKQNVLKIGDVTKKLKHGKNAELVPRGYIADVNHLPQSTLKHLRWLLQKDHLKQDVFLIGLPGTIRRRLVMQYLEITKREYEYLALTRDTTESDIKQRREIRGGSAFYVDQAAIRAALEGRVLILDGIEKAERNVLPILNNLLENREVQLDDGRFLVAPDKYDKLLLEHTKDELKSFQLVRVDENFKVIALGLPIPKFRGHSLDPPLRSRFQARNIESLSFKEQYQFISAIAPKIPSNNLCELLSFVYSLLAEESSSLGVPEFPVDNINLAARIWNINPNQSSIEIIEKLFPFSVMLKKEGQETVKNAMETFNLLDPKTKVKKILANVDKVDPVDNELTFANVSIRWNKELLKVKVPKGCREGQPQQQTSIYVPAESHERLLVEMIVSHSVHDFCLIGSKGCGKSTLVSKFAELMNYEITPIMLYQDMTSRDLVQQRRMLPNGDTVWQHAPLVHAALKGGLAVLDGIHRVHHSTLNILHRLVHDREIELFDGTRLMHSDRHQQIKDQCNLTDSQLEQKKILPIHPSFRIISLAEPPNVNDSSQQWLTPELLTLFLHHHVKPLSVSEEMKVMSESIPVVSEKTEQSLLNFVQKLRQSQDSNLQALAGSLSTRQLLRIMKRLTKYPEECLNSAVNKACLSRFLPQLTRSSLNQALEESGIVPLRRKSDKTKPISYAITDGMLVLGSTKCPVNRPENRTLVPDILFYDNLEHLQVMEDMLRDFLLGEHLLLVGNQGVGKNKVADRFLQLLNLPRQYIQLHRDTTVQTLTVQTTVQDGVMIYEDSPLVKAVKNGQILVIDEGDKAPTHVTCILKSLLESSHMHLADGRKIVPPHFVGATNESDIKMHKDFRVVVLANRPGFPFLGNDFYGALGDLFACHSVDNPSSESEFAMLRKYGPDVAEESLRKLSSAFGELRNLADQGLLNYPYSTRELVNIVKHLQMFPDEAMTTVVGNVFDFDLFGKDAQETIVNTLNKHGIPLGKTSKFEIHLSPKFPLPAPSKVGTWGLPTDKDTSKFVRLPYEIFQLDFTNPLPFTPRNFDLDRLDMRCDKFSEQTAYWQLPINDVNIVSDVCATDLGDIFVSTVNPVSVYRINPVLKMGWFTEFYYDFFPTSKGYFKPRVTLAVVKTEEHSDNLLLHEEMTNTLLFVDNQRRTVNHLGVGHSMYQKIVDKVTQSAKTVYGADSAYFRMLPEMSKVDGTVVIYQKFGQLLDVKNFIEMTNKRINLPFKIDDCFWSTPKSLLITSTDNESAKLRIFSLDLDENEAKMKPVTYPSRSLSDLKGLSVKSTNQDLISHALHQNYLAPNRLLYKSSLEDYGMISMGFPELDSGDLFNYSKKGESLVKANQPYWANDASLKILNPSSQFCILPQIGQLVKSLPFWRMPEKVVTKDLNTSQLAGFMEVVDFPNRQVSYLPVPGAKFGSPYTSWVCTLMETFFLMDAYGTEGVVTADVSGGVRLWETSSASLRNSEAAWRKMIGANEEELRLTIDKEEEGLDKLTEPKHGITDPTGAPHIGGGMFAGGVGGFNTAGMGGIGGPYRLDLGHQVHQLPDSMKEQVPEHIRQKAREMAKRAHKQRLKEIQMSEFEADLYDKFYRKVEKQITRLRFIIDSLQAKGKERQWVRHQTSGDLDEGKLIEGITGEKTVYRKRAEKEPEPGSPQQKPKWLRICPDVSGSMYRFNGYDARLERTLEACLMVMEALEGHEHKIKYEIVGHSGEEMAVDFVLADKPPKNKKERLDALKTMLAHSQFCASGDHTLEATKLAVKQMSTKEADEKFVILLSDANLDRYGIKPAQFAECMTADESVNVFAIFIGSLGDQATTLKRRLPSGKAFVCKRTDEIPQILQQIFTSTIVSPSS